ncbi:hypothetical protein TTHERM_00378599 (macronuclear) [Tetrahymena thermophila SB210]|uniref:Uncharacterized protein n=1 Tax=Tetrahymena thermophila (strain SB210) TaxID=312017 RepID=A4VDZ4_TETTS|nr:hypothetical protein TTHERM_00378599 [Tetrahymena thermophila SB210]EDK31747.2 hypothetical protein TTHERM_00378599 [Tetrahymena thermophila SB210]|eukprot:XP_001471333.2 hypothetical protein TTHERM_00378599 [Tetrahymena thermophila SB210]
MGERFQVLPQKHNNLLNKDLVQNSLQLQSSEQQINQINYFNQMQQQLQQNISNSSSQHLQINNSIQNPSFQMKLNHQQLINLNQNPANGQIHTAVLPHYIQNAYQNNYYNNCGFQIQNQIHVQQCQNRYDIANINPINTEQQAKILLKNEDSISNCQIQNEQNSKQDSYSNSLNSFKLKDQYKKCVAIKQLSVQKQIVKILCDTLADSESLQSVANYEIQFYTEISKMARLLLYDSFKIQNNAQFFWGPLNIQRSIRSDIKNLQKLISRFYLNQIFSLKKEWLTLQKEQLKQNYTLTKEEDLKQLFQSQFEENQTQLTLDLETCGKDGNDYGNTQGFQQSPEFVNKQKKLFEISLKIQHLIQFLSETTEEECDKNKNQRNGMWDYANTVFELLDKQTEDIQQSCILLASDRSSMTHFDSTALGVALYYYVNLQPSPTGQFFYGITNLPKITYISFKKSWDGLTEDVLNWNPIQNISVNPSIQTIVITESSFDYPPYNFNNFSCNNQQNIIRPNTYKICIDQIEFEKHNKGAEKSNQYKIKSDDIVYIFEKIIYPLVRVHKPSVIIMNHNFSYTSENGPLKDQQQKLNSNNVQYDLKPTDFASILQTLGTVCSQKVVLVSNNKFTDFQSEFNTFQCNQKMTDDLIESQKVENLQFQSVQSLPRKKRQIEQQPLDIQISPIIPNYHKQISNVLNTQTEQQSKKIQKANQKIFQRQLAENQADAKQDFIIIDKDNEDQLLSKNNNDQQNSYKNILVNNQVLQTQFPNLINTSQYASGKAASFLLQNDSANLHNLQNNQQHQSLVQQPRYFQSNQLDVNLCQINQTNLYANQQQSQSIISCVPNYVSNLNQFQDSNMIRFLDANQQMNQVSKIQQISSYLPAHLNQPKIFYQSQQALNSRVSDSNFNQKNQIKSMQSASNEKKRRINLQNQQSDIPIQKNKNQQFIDNVSKYYQKILQSPIISRSGKAVCFYIQKYMDLDTQKLQQDIEELNQKILQEKSVLEIQNNCENTQQETQQQIQSTQSMQNNIQSQNLNPKQDKEAALNQSLAKLKDLQKQFEIIQEKKKVLLKNINEIFSQNKWRLSNFVFNWQIVVKLIRDEDEIEKYLLTNTSIDNVQGSIEEIFKLDQTVDKSQQKIAAIIFSLYKQQQSQRQQQIYDLIEKKELFEKKQSSQKEVAYRFYKKYTEYVLQTLLQTLYSNAEIKDVFSNSFKSKSNYLNQVNPHFQLYVQEINKNLILQKEKHIRQYFLEEGNNIPELSYIIKDNEMRCLKADQNMNFLSNYSDKQYQKDQVPEDQQIITQDQQEPETNQIRQTKASKKGEIGVSSALVRGDTINQNKDATNNNQIEKQSSQFERIEEEEKLEKKKIEEIELSKFFKNFKNVNQKCSKESLKFKLSTEIKGLNYITNLKAQSQNQLSNPSLLKNFHQFKNISNLNFNSQQFKISESDFNQPKTAQVRQLNVQMNSIQNNSEIFKNSQMNCIQTNSEMMKNAQMNYIQTNPDILKNAQMNYIQTNPEILKNQYLYNNQLVSNNSNIQTVFSHVNSAQQQYQNQNLIRNDIKLQENLRTKKLMAKKYKSEIFDIRQQKIVKLKTSQRLVLYDEDCQIQVIYLPQNTLEIYLFNLKIQNNYNHVILTQPYPNSEIFDAKYIPVQQQDVRFSSSLCYNENFVFKVFGESIQSERTINQIEIINRITKEYRLLKYNGSNSQSLQIVSQFSSSCFFSPITQLHYISCFGGYDPERKPVTQAGLIEVNLNNFTYKIAETLNKSDFSNEYFIFYKSRPMNGKKCHPNLQNVNQEKNQQLTAERSVKDFWKKVPHFFSSSQSVYDEVSDCIYVFGGNANNRQSSNNFQESIIKSSLSCNSFSWEEYLCFVKFQNVSRSTSLKDAIFLKLEVKNMNEIIYQNNIFLNEQKIQTFDPVYGAQGPNAKKMQESINKKAEFSTLFRHSNILSYRIQDQQNKEAKNIEGKMEIEQNQSTSSTFVIQQSHPTHFKFEKLAYRNDQQPHQLLSMAFSMDKDPLPKIQLQVKVGCC